MYKFKKPGESEGSLIRRFIRGVAQEGIIEEAKRGMFWENSQDIKKRKLKERQKAKKELHY